ncbi:MAG TPA: hypothetical protein VJU61_19015 [Polyangiaceae bacterium]|nr:hypothetical protein [Polyangiaceae bacterium]
MRATDRFQLRPSESDEGRSELWVSETKLAKLVPGIHLEAQYAVDDPQKPVFLLLTSYNSPFEEQIHILLVDDQGHLVEQAQLGGAYAPGILKDLRVVSSERLSFDFQGPVLVTVHPRPRGWLRRSRLDVVRSSNINEGKS